MPESPDIPCERAPASGARGFDAGPALTCALLGFVAVALAAVQVADLAGATAGSWLAVGAFGNSLALLGALAWWQRTHAADTRARATRFAEVSQRARLLDKVVTSAPAALILCDTDGRISLANSHANELLNSGTPLEGQSFQEVLDRFPPEMRAAIGRPQFVVVDGDQQTESYHVSSRDLGEGTSIFKLHMLRRVTDEVNRQEVDVWKQVIRVFSHEINNSLAPIASLTHSARQLVGRDKSADKLERILDTVRERTTHLDDFLKSYAQFAKLPRPVKRDVGWDEFLTRMQTLARFERPRTPPDQPGYFDEAQLEQVLLNLVKNAHESGSDSDAIEVEIESTARGVAMRIMDRGPGMSAASLRQAHLPFYSTKRTGTGIGLALCRDIAVAHGGQMQLHNRDGGGLVVTCWLPDRDHPDGAPSE